MTAGSKRGAYRVVLIPGDGIGPEVTAAAVAVLEAAAATHGFRLAFERHEAGAGCYLRTGRAMSDETFAGPMAPKRACWAASCAAAWTSTPICGRSVSSPARPHRSLAARRAASTTRSCARTPKGSTSREAAA